MAKRKAAPADEEAMETCATERLITAVEQLSDDINGLMQVAEEGTLLTAVVNEIRTLTSALDDIRAEIEWASRNLMHARTAEPSPHLTSMPVDPCDPEWGTKLNRLGAHDLPSDQSQGTPPAAEEAGVESVVFCCESPRLAWQGDPEAPSVVCQACGYVVAEYRNVVDQRAEQKNAFRRQQAQGRLWDEEAS
jgi:hypothetical protein